MDPKKGFVIMKDDDLADTRRRSLDLLYQPLLQPTGYALINILWRLSEIRTNSLFQRPLSELLTYLNVDLPAFRYALSRVEGAGLVRFFQEKTPHHFYIFHLIQPRSAREFFRDDLLSVGLLEIIGEQHFADLSQVLIPRPHVFNRRDVHDRTRNFLEVYRVDHKHLTNLPDMIRQVRSGITAKVNSSLQGDHQFIDESPDFDFKFFMQIINKTSFSDPKEVTRHRHLILTVHALYGIDEPAMAKYIGMATSVANNQVDFKKFKLLISKAFQGNAKKPVKTKYKGAATDAKSKPQKGNSRVQQDEQMLIRAADYYAPVQFLYNLKKQLNPNGVVTRQEENMLQQAMDYSAFRDNKGVINILSYYSIVERRMPMLSSAFMQYMITAWNRANVNTPGEALAEIKKHRQKRVQRWRNYKSKRSRNQFSYRKQATIKQKLPKWARSDYKVKLHPTSQKLRQKIKRQLKDMNHQPNRRKGGHK